MAGGQSETALGRVPEAELMDDPESAAVYAAADFAAVNQAFVDRLTDLAGTRPNAAVVDLGCGPADILIRLVRTRPRWTVTAVDGAPAMLALARKAIAAAGLAGSITLVQADAKATGLAGGSFDVVCSNSILHHVASPGAFWTEVKRLVRPGGLVFLRDLSRPPTAEAARRIVAQYAGNEPPRLQEEFLASLGAAYSPPEVEQQLAAVGLGFLSVAMVSNRHLEVAGRIA